MAKIISAQRERWPALPTEDPIWGLVRIVIAQQVNTKLACSMAQRLLLAFPRLSSREKGVLPSIVDLRDLGLPRKRADACLEILQRAIELSELVNQGNSWEAVLGSTKGVGPWTVATFRIMVLRDPDVLPTKDIGLERAISKVYGMNLNIEHLAENWKPYRSVACWYLWRTLGNEQLG